MKYRISFMVEAENAREGWKKLGLDSIGYLPSIDSDPLTTEEETIILELARTSLADGETYDYIAEELDLSDDFLKELQEKIERKMLTPA